MKYIFGRMVIPFFALLFFYGIGAVAAAFSDSCRVKKGKPFVVKMPSNPTTGYSWRWNKDRSVANVDSVSRKFVASKTGAIGAAGVDVWTFKVKKEGVYYLHFSYVRPWENDVVVKRKEIVIIVY